MPVVLTYACNQFHFTIDLVESIDLGTVIVTSTYLIQVFAIAHAQNELISKRSLPIEIYLRDLERGVEPTGICRVSITIGILISGEYPCEIK